MILGVNVKIIYKSYTVTENNEIKTRNEFKLRTQYQVENCEHTIPGNHTIYTKKS